MEILIVDDDPVACRLLEEIVERLPGCVPRTYLSPSAALRYAQATRPALIFLDYHMPEMNGVAFLKALGAGLSGDLPAVVMITISADRDVRAAALEVGAADFVTKPFDPIEVRVRARNHLELAARRREIERQAQLLADRATVLTAAVQAANAQVRERELETIYRLTRAAEFRDNETGLHIVRMARFSAIIGTALGLDEDSVELLELAAPMHDVGKVGTPDAVLLKAGPLDDAEWSIMRDHARLGYELLKGSASTLVQCGAEIAYTHHERFDGTGYPRGLAGDSIPLTGRIVALADIFDALTSVRPYKPAWNFADAVAEIRRLAGTHLDPRVVAAFDATIGSIIATREAYSDAA